MFDFFNAEHKVVDLAGIVFLLFVGVTISKYVGPKVFCLHFLSRLRSHLARYGNIIFKLSIPLAVLLISYGFFKGGLDRVLPLIGLTIVIFTYHLCDLDNQDLEVRARAFDIVGMGFVIGCVLLSLWFMGTDLFRL